MDALPADLVERARVELNETPDTRAAGLSDLHAYYDAHQSERPFRSDAAYLLMFLRHAKFDVAKARARIAAVEKWLKDCKDEVGDVHALRGEMFRELYGQGFLGLLGERRTNSGGVVTLVIPRLMEPLKDPSILLKWNVWTLTRAVHNPYIQVEGQLILESFKDYSFMHAIRYQQVPNAIMKKNFKFAQECMPFRMRGIWLVYQPKWVGFLFALVKPFLSKKLKQRVRVFGDNLEELHNEIDPAVLPAEFGGSHPDSGAAWFAEQLELEALELQGPGQGAPAGATEAEAGAGVAAAVGAPAGHGGAAEDIEVAVRGEEGAAAVGDATA